MADLASSPRLTAEQFLQWAEQQPGRHELVDGTVVAMAPERIAHVEMKGEIYARLREAIRAAKLPCQALADGATVRVDQDTIFEPDALVRCGPPLLGDGIAIPDPMVIVEVLSPSSQSIDLGIKLEGYFRVDTVRHYLIVDAGRRLVIHHERRPDGLIVAHIIHDGALRLDPPGIALCALFED